MTIRKEEAYTGTFALLLAFVMLAALLFAAPARAGELTLEYGRVRNGIAPPGVWYQPGFDYAANLDTQSFRLAYTRKSSYWPRWQVGWDSNQNYSGRVTHVSDENYRPGNTPACASPCEIPRQGHYSGASNNLNFSFLPTIRFGRLGLFGRIGGAIYEATMTVKNGNCDNGYTCAAIYPGVYRMSKSGFTPYFGGGLEYRGFVMEVIKAPSISATQESIQRGTTAFYIGHTWKL